MTTLSRVKVEWGGSAVVGPGLSTFYFPETDMAGMPAALVNFFTAIRNFFPTTVTWTIPSTGDQIDDATGDLVGIWTASGGATVGGGAASVDWTPGVGARVVWNTLGITRGRRVHGTTFLCPLSETEVTAGTINGGTVTGITSAANALLTASGGMSIFSPPKAATPTKPAAAGNSFTIQSATVPTKMTWLRSRRV